MKKRNYKNLYIVTLILSISIALFFAGCGGGGGGASTPETGNSVSTGTVALFLADAPNTNLTSLKVWVTEAILIPSENDSNLSPIVIYKSENPLGKEVDLLSLRDEDLLLTVHKKIPVGYYEKIRLKITHVEAEPDQGCDYIKLPSGKIDLNPRGGFLVKPGLTYAVRLDFDAQKCAINFHPAGNSGKCILRPVVFVSIEEVIISDRCPQLLAGTITEVYPTKLEERDVYGFDLLLKDELDKIFVKIFNDTSIFDDSGEPLEDINDLRDEIGQVAKVRGRLDSDGDIQASLVVLGGVLKLNGIVKSALDDTGKFLFELYPGQGFSINNPLSVKVFDDTLVLIGCDKIVGKEYIQPGLEARVFGIFIDGPVLNAVTVLLKPRIITGELTKVDPVLVNNEGYELTVKVSDTDEETVFLEEGQPVYVEGDGEISVELLMDLVDCDPREVRILMNPEKPDTAAKVLLQPEKIEVTVAYVNFIDRYIITTDDKQIEVQPGATIITHDSSGYKTIDLSKLKAGDQLECFGFQSETETEKCAGFDTDFFAFVIVVQ
jgi:hypothetical protein